MQIVPKGTICMKCQSLFAKKNKKNVNLSSAEFAPGVVKVNLLILKFEQALITFLRITYRMANSTGPDQTATLGSVWSGSTLFALLHLSQSFM